MINKDVTVIIRSSNERTADISYQLMVNMFGKEKVKVLSNIRPFSETVKKTLLIGIEENRKWTLTVDADLLLSEKGVKKYIDECENFVKFTDKKAFFFDGLLYDKFFGAYRTGGGHLYNTKYMEKAYKYIESSRNELKPESYIKRKMHKWGYRNYNTNIVIGLHDFEQYYSDVFRKGILHAQKSGAYNKIDKFDKLAQTDPYFKWFCNGIRTGQKLLDNNDKVVVDIEYFKRFQEKYKNQFDKQAVIDINEINALIDKYYLDNGMAEFKQMYSRKSLFINDFKHILRPKMEIL